MAKRKGKLNPFAKLKEAMDGDQARTKENTLHAPKGAKGKPKRDANRKKRNKGRG